MVHRAVIGNDGRGPVAPYLDPPPRDFTAGVYKLRTTESGQPPSFCRNSD